MPPRKKIDVKNLGPEDYKKIDISKPNESFSFTGPDSKEITVKVATIRNQLMNAAGIEGKGATKNLRKLHSILVEKDFESAIEEWEKQKVKDESNVQEEMNFEESVEVSKTNVEITGEISIVQGLNNIKDIMQMLLEKSDIEGKEEIQKKIDASFNGVKDGIDTLVLSKNNNDQEVPTRQVAVKKTPKKRGRPPKNQETVVDVSESCETDAYFENLKTVLSEKAAKYVEESNKKMKMLLRAHFPTRSPNENRAGINYYINVSRGKILFILNLQEEVPAQNVGDLKNIPYIKTQKGYYQGLKTQIGVKWDPETDTTELTTKEENREILEKTTKEIDLFNIEKVQATPNGHEGKTLEAFLTGAIGAKTLDQEQIKNIIAQGGNAPFVQIDPKLLKA